MDLFPGPCAEYELPYQSAVGKMEPVLGTMIEIAVKKGQRPPLISHWIINKVWISLCTIKIFEICNRHDDVI